MEQSQELLNTLFKKEFSKMVAVISRIFGLQHIETAEDIVSDTFLTAIESWRIQGKPKNPTAWLYKVAKQKMAYYFRRNKIFAEKVVPNLTSDWEEGYATPEVSFSKENIKDSQLRMIFAVCNPLIASEAQIGLALRILCGFGIEEIAEAFLTNKETINKRLFRAKEKFRLEKVTLEMPLEITIDGRLDNVLHIIYLLFTEGYYSKTQNQLLRKELCLEGLRLGLTLASYKKTNQPKTSALIALMCFHASRFAARYAGTDEFVLYENQNERLWDKEMIKQGIIFLGKSANGNEVSSFHLEARIACWHCTKENSKQKWKDILQLYNQLLLVNYSPGVALNRTFALYKVLGSEKALEEAEKLGLVNNHFYFILLGELYKNIDVQKAITNYEKACSLAKTEVELQILKDKIRFLK
ncbi:MAG TPA: sigma-70 family RNA polymerase sigma factor [Mucilaginibacter sp.]|jgi:RNA polymerase sigma-70 factor (ECF subfamily)